MSESAPPVEPLDDVTGAGSTEESTASYVRSPVDVLRLVVFALTSLVLLGVVLGIEDSVFGLERDLVKLFDFLSPAMARILQGTLDIIHVFVVLGLWVTPFVVRRYRLLGYVVGASVGAFLVMGGIDALVARETTTELVNRIADRAGIEIGVADGVIALAQLAAMFIVTAPFVGRLWRRAGAVFITLYMLGRLIVAPRLPVDLVLALPIGAVVGTVVLLAFGRPDRRPTTAAIRSGLVAAGLDVVDVRPASVDARGSTPYFAAAADGTGFFVKVLGSDHRAADLLFRGYRYLKLKDVGDTRPFSSLRRTIEHEALVALMARDIGIRTPRLRAVSEVGADSMLLAYDQIAGRSLDSLEAEEITEDLMRQIWQQVGLLQRSHIAHRDLRLANVFVADDGQIWMIDFGFSELAASDELLGADVAQLLASMAVVVGTERAVSSAVEVLGTDTVGRCLPRLQAAALSGSTQEALKEQKGLLGELQEAVIGACSVDEIEYADLERVSRKTILMIVVLVLATYFLLPQLADLPAAFEQVRDADWSWAPLVLLMSILTYVGATFSLAGSVPVHLKGGPLFLSTWASSFASKLAPAGLGGMALNVRFLQKQGLDQAVAVSGVGLNTLGGFAGHISLVGIFLVWAGREAFGSFSLPDPKWFLLAAGVALLLGVIGMLIPAVRRLAMRTVVPAVAKAFDGVGAVLRRPVKVVMLIGGSAFLTFAYLTTLYFSMEAFGGGLPFATVGAVYLVGAAVAQAAPTPGGLGAVEVALVGGLVAAGLDNAVAVPSVFLFRLFTFWVPVLPGWLAFQWLERNDQL